MGVGYHAAYDPTFYRMDLRAHLDLRWAFSILHRKEVNMLKVHILVHLLTLQWLSHIPLGEARSSKGEIYTRDAPCPMCEGDRQSKRVSLANFDQLPRHPALRCGRP